METTKQAAQLSALLAEHALPTKGGCLRGYAYLGGKDNLMIRSALRPNIKGDMIMEKSKKATRLDLDLVIQILAEKFPASNIMDNESYAELMPDLKFFNIITDQDFRDLLDQQRTFVKQYEAEALKDTDPTEFSGDNTKRIESGVFYSWIGLARAALQGRVGEDAWSRYMNQIGFGASTRGPDSFRAKGHRFNNLDS